METSDLEADATEPEDESTEQGDEEMDEKGEQGETKMEDEENIDGKDKEEDGENSKVGRLPINVRKETSLRTSIRTLKLVANILLVGIKTTLKLCVVEGLVSLSTRLYQSNWIL